MTLAQAFSTAWKDLKKTVSAVATFVVKNQASIQTAVADASTGLAVLDPNAAPIITSFDTLEEAVMGKIAALAHDASAAPTLQALFAEEWPSIQALITTLKGHPTVASVTAALAPPAKTA